MNRLLFTAIAYLSSVLGVIADTPIQGPVSLFGYSIYYYTGAWTTLQAQLGFSGAQLAGVPTGLYSLPWNGNLTSATYYALAWSNAGTYGGSALQYPNELNTTTPFFGYSYSGNSIMATFYSKTGVLDATTLNETLSLSYAIAVSQ